MVQYSQNIRYILGKLEKRIVILNSLSSLRKRTQREITSPKREENPIPYPCEISLLNEAGLPKGMWKLVKIQEINIGRDER